MSMQDQEVKNFNWARVIIAAAWIAIIGGSLLLSSNPFGPVNAQPLLWAIPIISLGYTIWLIAKTGTDTLSENNGFYALGLVLAAASAAALAYCPFC